MFKGDDLPLTETKKPRIFYGWFVVLAAFFIMVVIWGTYYTFGVFFKPMLTEFGWTTAATSGAFTLAMLVNSLSAIAMGRLTDRFGPRLVITGCGLFLGSGYLLMSQITTIWQLYLFYGVIIGIGMSASFIPLMATIPRWFVKRRGIMSGITVSGIGVGTMIMPPVASWLISIYDWHTSYIIVGIIALTLIILAAQFLRHHPGQIGQLPYGENEVNEPGPSLEATGGSFQEAIHSRQFWLLCAILLCFAFCEYTILVYIAPHATELGISAASAANILAIIGGASIAGRIVLGGAADKMGTKLTLIFAYTLMVVALVWLLAAKELWMLYLFAAIFGLAYGGFIPIGPLMAAELFGLSSIGAIMGIGGFAYTMGGAFGPLASGRIFDVTSSYQLAFLVCVAVGILGIILALLLKPRASEGGENDPERST